MKKSTIIISLILTLFKLQAQDYLISFAATGDTTVVSTVKVENLTSGATVNLNGGDILHLTALVGIGKLDKNNKDIHLYPNPMQGQAFLTFFAPENADALIRIADLSGKTVYQASKVLSPGSHTFRVSSVKLGMYFLKVTGKNYNYCTKLVSLNNLNSKANIEYVSSVKNPPENQLKSTTATIDMPYKTGDRLLFKGISGKYSTIVTDVPSVSKTITFNFLKCTDADNNNYPTVTIGSQVWMAENLKTTKYKDGTSIPLVTDNTVWGALTTPGYCWYNNDIVKKSTYGALYNQYAVNTSKLAPAGWHVSTDAEWKQLEMALGMTQAQADATGYRGTDQGTQLKSTSGWNIGGNGTNSSGFSALPGGYRGHLGSIYLGDNGYWWVQWEYSPIHAWTRILYYNLTTVFRLSGYDETTGQSVRCVKDQ